MLAVEFVIVLSQASLTVMEGLLPRSVPAVAVLEGWVVNASLLAAPAARVRLVLPAVRDPLLAVRVLVPAVFKVTLKVPDPATRFAAVAATGAWGSSELMLVEVV